MSNTRPPGISGQDTARLWVVLLVAALGFLATSRTDLFASMNASSDGPHEFFCDHCGHALVR